MDYSPFQQYGELYCIVFRRGTYLQYVEKLDYAIFCGEIKLFYIVWSLMFPVMCSYSVILFLVVVRFNVYDFCTVLVWQLKAEIGPNPRIIVTLLIFCQKLVLYANITWLKSHLSILRRTPFFGGLKFLSCDLLLASYLPEDKNTVFQLVKTPSQVSVGTEQRESTSYLKCLVLSNQSTHTYFFVLGRKLM